MEEIIYYSRLYDFYKSMLTIKQQNTFKDYFFENLSIEEIANNYGVSKNAVSKTIKNIKSSLEDYEQKLHLKKYFEALRDEFDGDVSILKRIEKYDSIILD